VDWELFNRDWEQIRYWLYLYTPGVDWDQLYRDFPAALDVMGMFWFASMGTALGFPDGWSWFTTSLMQRAASHPEACFVCGCYRLEGCFAPGVKITMADGSLRNIEEVRADDMVRNAKTGAPVKVRQVIEGPEPLPLIRFGYEGAAVTTSQAHPVLTAAGLKPANELKKGDTIFDAQGAPHPITTLESLPVEDGQRVINVALEAASSDADERLLVSDGIITGDFVLQVLLKKQK
jgi:hypothetical protein